MPSVGVASREFSASDSACEGLASRIELAPLGRVRQSGKHKLFLAIEPLQRSLDDDFGCCDDLRRKIADGKSRHIPKAGSTDRGGHQNLNENTCSFNFLLQ